ncbi:MULTISPECIES: hypothetical protein [Sphingomonadales]|uniref:Uncharacterized protein n=1 Tax=Sphingobium ummariense RL-3 TaxID=1346791 RepID=T0KB72_9SPHN|nr:MULTISPECIES: hypothetical protein [Sphingomonadaceae]EQB33944.1 hypothetical protein M529_02720 [Sphingobium ummariense RL-3]WOF45892.1 hypothetical protein KNJ79_21120 [Sphingopyxis indica]
MAADDRDRPDERDEQVTAEVKRGREKLSLSYSARKHKAARPTSSAIPDRKK